MAEDHVNEVRAQLDRVRAQGGLVDEDGNKVNSQVTMNFLEDIAKIFDRKEND